MFKSFLPSFDFQGRVSGRQYGKKWLLGLAKAIAWYCILGIAITPVVLHLNSTGFFGDVNMRKLGEISGKCASLVVLPIAILAMTGLNARRLHDMNLSGWWGIIIAYPLTWLILPLVFPFIPGNRGPNRYGPDPSAPADLQTIPSPLVK